MGEKKRMDDLCQPIPARCIKKAEYLLENYIALKEQERGLVEELSRMQLYTHDDVLYLLAGVGSSFSDTERVQTSNISNPCEKAVLNADDMQERLNRNIGRAEKRQLQWVSDNLRIVDVSLKVLAGKNKELYRAAVQLYVEGVPQNKVKDSSGCVYSRYQVKKMQRGIVEKVAENIVLQEQFKEAAHEVSGQMWWEYEE